MRNILFVCTGNTCRSSMTEALMKKILKDSNINDIHVSSAGIMVHYHGGASQYAISVMKQNGIDLSSHIARQITREMVDKAKLILTMTSQHKRVLLSHWGYAADKIFTLKEFALNDKNNEDISDPFGLSEEHYKKCADEIYDCLKLLAEKIKNKDKK